MCNSTNFFFSKCLQLLHAFVVGITLATEPQDLVLATNSRILLRIVVLIPSEEILSMNCIISLRNGTKITAASNESLVMLMHALPGIYRHDCICDPGSKQISLSAYLNIPVEDSFSQLDLQMRCSVCSGTYQKDFSVTFVHQHVFPVDRGGAGGARGATAPQKFCLPPSGRPKIFQVSF